MESPYDMIDQEQDGFPRQALGKQLVINQRYGLRTLFASGTVGACHRRSPGA
jgi:hypothetical protein